MAADRSDVLLHMGLTYTWPETAITPAILRPAWDKVRDKVRGPSNAQTRENPALAGFFEAPLPGFEPEFPD